MGTFTRPCGKCKKQIYYSSSSGFAKAERNNTMCPSCRTSLTNKSPKRNVKKENNPAWVGYKDIPGKVFSKLKRGAKTRKLAFEITIEDIQDKYEAQNKTCAFSGLMINFGKNASVDRIDSRFGYTKDNIQIVDKELNMMKKDMDNEKFINWCWLVAQHSGI